MEHDSHTDPVVVERRIRNSQLDWLEIAVAVETDPPPFDFNELINQWFDWNPDVPDADAYPAPTYTAQEAERLVAVGNAVNRLCDGTPKNITDAALALATPEWAEVFATSERALAEMLRRGRLPDRD